MRQNLTEISMTSNKQVQAVSMSISRMLLYMLQIYYLLQTSRYIIKLSAESPFYSFYLSLYCQIPFFSQYSCCCFYQFKVKSVTKWCPTGRIMMNRYRSLCYFKILCFKIKATKKIMWINSQSIDNLKFPIECQTLVL